MKNTTKIVFALIAVILFLTTIMSAFAAAPVIVGTIPDITKGEDAAAWDQDLTSFESDPENNPVAWSFLGVDTNLLGIPSYNPTTHKVTFTLKPNAHGTDVITFKLTDSESLSDTQDVTITIQSINDAPVLQNLPAQTIVNGQSKQIDLYTYASDADSDILTWSVTQDATKVACTITQAGVLTMQNHQSYTSGAASCKVTIYDGTVAAEKEVSITVVAESKIADMTAATMPAWARTVSSQSRGEFTITNNGNVDLANLAIEASDLVSGVNTISKTKISFSPSTISSLAIGANTKVTVTASGIANGQALGTYTGTVSIKSGTATLNSKTISIEVRDPIADFSIPTEVVMPQTERNKTVQKIIEITNNGDYDLANFAITCDADAKYKVTFSSYSSAFLKGDKRSITVTAFVPDSADSGIYRIGQITFTSDKKTKAIPLKFDVKTMLSMYNFDVKVGDEGTDSDVSNGAKIDKKARPGDEVDFKFKIENLFDKDSEQDYEINDIKITVSIDDEDIGEDEIEEESDTFDLDPEEKSSEKVVTIKIPNEADEKDYDVTITVEGEDEESVEHTLEWRVVLQVKKEKHDIIIEKTEISPQSVRAGGNVIIDVKLRNVGSTDEKYARVTATETSLKLDYAKANIFLDKDADDSENVYHLEIPVTVLKTADAKEYAINVKLYYDGDKAVDGQNVKLIVLPADTTAASTITSTATGTNVATGTTTATTSTGTTTIQLPTTLEDTSKKSFEGNWYIITLVALIVIILGLVVFLFVKFLK